MLLLRNSVAFGSNLSNRNYATLKDSDLLIYSGVFYLIDGSPNSFEGHQEHWKDYQLHEDDC